MGLDRAPWRGIERERRSGLIDKFIADSSPAAGLQGNRLEAIHDLPTRGGTAISKPDQDRHSRRGLDRKRGADMGGEAYRGKPKRHQALGLAAATQSISH